MRGIQGQVKVNGEYPHVWRNNKRASSRFVSPCFDQEIDVLRFGEMDGIVEEDLVDLKYDYIRRMGLTARSGWTVFVDVLYFFRVQFPRFLIKVE
jgi:hypothetical protein